MNAAQLTVDALEQFGDYVCLHFEGTEYRSQERFDYAGRLAQVLTDHQVRPGDRVVVMMVSCPEVLAAFQAIWRIGAVIVPIMPQLAAPEVRYIVENSGAQVVLTSPELVARVGDATATIEGFREILIFADSDDDRAENIAPAVESAAPLTAIHESDDADLAVLVYTSGTTGRPKGVMLSHGNLITNARATSQLFCESPRATSLMVLPLSHVYGILLMTLNSLMGNASVLHRTFVPEEVLKSIEKYRIERASLVPTMLIHLINSPVRDKYDVSSLRFVTAGSAPLSLEVQAEFQRVYGSRLADGYGQSEATCVVSAFRDDEAVVPGSCGRPIPTVEVCVMDDEGHQVAPGVTGEVCIRGTGMMRGYWHNEQATAEAIVDGWLHSGDIGHLDEAGYLYITDRKKDLIVKGGENISPRQIEEAIYHHPAVAEVAVFGVPCRQFQEEIVAAVVLKPGQQATPEDIQKLVCEHVSRFKQPKFVEFREALPKNVNGKILKRTLREEWVAARKE